MKSIRTNPTNGAPEGDERPGLYLYNAGPISFRADGLDEAWRIVRALNAVLEKELGDRAEEPPSIGFPRADDSNFAPRNQSAATDGGKP